MNFATCIRAVAVATDSVTTRRSSTTSRPPAPLARALKIIASAVPTGRATIRASEAVEAVLVSPQTSSFRTQMSNWPGEHQRHAEGISLSA